MSRLPRFQRSPDIPALLLTVRDGEILQLVHRHRFLRSDHLTKLVPGSRQQTLRRLQRLYHHGFLERPRSQIDYYQSGSRRMVYGLGNKGAAWLKRQQSLPFLQLDWPQENQVGRLFLDHSLMIADIMVALELACRQRTTVRWLTVDDLPTLVKRAPVQWRVRQTSVIPDQIFGLEFNGQTCWYFLEADRGTMPVTRRNDRQTSVQRKLSAYAATWQQNLHERVLGIRRFRVLTVTTDAERVRKIIVACPPTGRGLFLFTDIATLLAQPDFFDVRWQTTRGEETVTLLD